MKTRMEKYYGDSTLESTRSSKNTELYNRVSENDMESFDVNSNVKVLGEASSIDVDQIREMLDRKYRTTPKKKSISIDEEAEIPTIDIDETREYDINSIIKKAKENKSFDYEVDRHKKLRNTQYDILKNLNIEDKNSPVQTKEEETLMDLINTITAKDRSNDEMDPLDLLTSLRGDDDTVVVGAMGEKEALKKELTSEIKNEILKEVKEEVSSFNTSTNTFTQSDFDDFNDLREDVESTKIIIKIIIVIIVLIFIAGIVFFINKYLGLELF